MTDDPTVATSPKYRCDYQGIQRGWADVYTSHLPCQFIDVTDVPDGAYTLEIELNADRTLVELDYDNNLISIPIELATRRSPRRPSRAPTTSPPATAGGTARECGWTAADTFACTPGQIGRVGCSAACGLGSCTGDPMIRVCDADRPDGNCSHPAAVDPTEFGGGESNDFAGPCPCDLGAPARRPARSRSSPHPSATATTTPATSLSRSSPPPRGRSLTTAPPDWYVPPSLGM